MPLAAGHFDGCPSTSVPPGAGRGARWHAGIRWALLRGALVSRASRVARPRSAPGPPASERRPTASSSRWLVGCDRGWLFMGLVGLGHGQVRPLTTSMAKPSLVGVVESTTFGDLRVRPPGGPPDLAIGDPVVRLASERPVPDGRMKRDGLSVEGQFPIRRRERGYHLAAATAGTFVDDGFKRDRDVEHVFVQALRYLLDEFMLHRLPRAAC